MKLKAGAGGLVACMGFFASCTCSNGVVRGTPTDGPVLSDGGGRDGAAADRGGQDLGVADGPAGGDAGGQPTSAGIPPECAAAADRGLAWLVTQQKADGSWQTETHPVATTGLALVKLETHAIDQGLSPFDPTYVYYNQVAKGLAYLFSQAHVVSVSPQTGGDPNVSGDGKGVAFYSPAGPHVNYETAIALMAVVAGKVPTRTVSATGSDVDGWTYLQVAQDVVDYFAFAQCDGCGAWTYTALDNTTGGDNSNTQYVTLALEYAEHPFYGFQCTIPDFVKLQLTQWVAFIQVIGGIYDGASGYSTPSSYPNTYKTGALLQQLAFLGENTTSSKVQAALGFLVRMWPEPFPAACVCADSWRGNPADYMAMWSIMKGLTALAVDDLGGIDWYADFCNVIIQQQQPDGSWPSMGCDTGVGAQGLLSTEWALLVLEKVAPPPPILQ